jgi:hypothetical protein
VQVGLFTVVKPLGTKMPGSVSVMFFPGTDSLRRIYQKTMSSVLPRPRLPLRKHVSCCLARALTGAEEFGGAKRFKA